MAEANPRGPAEPGPVLITGASGFLGPALVDVFRQAGFPVRILVRATSPRRNLTWTDVEITEGDMRDPAAVAAAMRGQRYLVHAAADYRLWAPDMEEIVRTNRDGTRVLMEAALKAGVERIVYTSSVATIKPHDDGTPADETRPLTPETAIGAYKRSKVVAERVVEEMVARDGLPAVIVNPSTPIGPRDVKPTPTGRIIQEAAMGRMPAFVDTGLNLAHVDDVAGGHLLALNKGRVGEKYILGGENVLLSQMLADIAGIVGRKPPTVNLPRAVVYPIAFVSEQIARVTGKAPFATIDGIRMSRYRMFFSDAKARAELGYGARPYREGLSDAIKWFRDAGYLR
ncbi:MULTISPECIES: hopanoid-associated sugar epimerase [Methylobacterium]|uniref:Aurachin B dehydrogenase n=2 Tax=Pseudomonadota TaxID=1224 RepID=A0ABQ4SQ99_9HYPH|nr:MULTISPECIES: hopanoid-associated sugar epimerase [Methylobacterium]PIU06457.1 MAG: NAD-dependent dehydratase [Methylobacterium sp. CG09_land_8_20_14_0_10_71_15]PIU14288.1 MAG: NAD-dependent dehydratase [Methylobacterium sp. CG08_land_8_20_14_0_20_71_15]GBU16664.1 UDP-galactose 4-epimerase [Methylobacterium sp.]GJE05396.1 Aurachin B dehydrogenase [Methylobacterium jeotgali]